jgi:hypothetical protein
MDTHQAAVVGSKTEDGVLTLLAHVEGEENRQRPSEKNSNNHEQMAQGKYFKEIASHLVNATHVHVTGTGQVQEQFIRYLATTPQFKDVKTEESTSNKMSDERLVEYITEKF